MPAFSSSEPCYAILDPSSISGSEKKSQQLRIRQISMCNILIDLSSTKPEDMDAPPPPALSAISPLKPTCCGQPIKMERCDDLVIDLTAIDDEDDAGIISILDNIVDAVRNTLKRGNKFVYLSDTDSPNDYSSHADGEDFCGCDSNSYDNDLVEMEDEPSCDADMNKCDVNVPACLFCTDEMHASEMLMDIGNVDNRLGAEVSIQPSESCTLLGSH